TNAEQLLGQTVKVKVDRPLGSKHPEYDFEYQVNYGFVPNTLSSDGEEQDVYVLGVDKSITEFEGKVIAVVKRIDDSDDKLIVVPDDLELSDEEIEDQIKFQEKWFSHNLVR